MNERQWSSGWYVDPQRPASVRYWDGEQWTEHRAERLNAGPDAWTIARGVAIGILGVIAVLWILGTYVL